jgi:hypothetical protein
MMLSTSFCVRLRCITYGLLAYCSLATTVLIDLVPQPLQQRMGERQDSLPCGSQICQARRTRICRLSGLQRC